MTPSEVMILVSALQLALRHPSYPPTSGVVVRKFIATFRSLVNEATIQRLIDLGFDKRYDDTMEPTSEVEPADARIKQAIALLEWWRDPANTHDDLVEVEASPEQELAITIMHNALVWAAQDDHRDVASGELVREMFQGNLDRLEARRQEIVAWRESHLAGQRA